MDIRFGASCRLCRRYARPSAVARTISMMPLFRGPSVARWGRHEEVAADGKSQSFLDFIVARNSFLAPLLRVAPYRVAATFANRRRGRAPVNGRAVPVVSCQHQFRRLRLRIEPKNLGSSVSNRNWMASLRLLRHSSLVSPCPFRRGLPSTSPNNRLLPVRRDAIWL